MNNDDTALKIRYQDECIVAIDKPPGLLVHRSELDRHETRFAVQLLRDQLGRHVYPAHRLDRPTSGVLLFAFDSKTASHLGQQMMAREVGKTYEAIVRGWTTGSGVVDYALKYKLDKIAEKHKRPQREAQPALSEYHTLANYELPFASGRYSSSRYSHIRLHPFTGRKHQLRRHMVHLRNPIIGDTTHGDGKQNKFMREQFSFENLALSCTQLQFAHPASGERITVTADVHPSFSSLLAQWETYQI